MKEVNTHTVKQITVRNSYKFVNPVFKPDKDGDLITFGEKPTNEIVKEIVILINPEMELTEIHRLLSKVVKQIKNKLNHIEGIVVASVIGVFIFFLF